MTTDHRERKFEEEIEAVLLGLPTEGVVSERPEGWDAFESGCYAKRLPVDYNPELCLIPRDVTDFLVATQPAEWAKLKNLHKQGAAERLLARLAKSIQERGSVDVLREGVKLDGCAFRLCFFTPSSGKNPDTAKLYLANRFSVLRQLPFNPESKQSLDLGLFLNGLPLFTAELKNPLTGQNVNHAQRQYMQDRDPRLPFFWPGRCLAHFAVDPDEVYVTTVLAKDKTRFLPFNQGEGYGRGNPPNALGYRTDYLWKEVWSRDSVLEIVEKFVQFVDEEEEGRKTGRKVTVFPRFHQLRAVRSLLAHAKRQGAGSRYLVQHSAGSGKSNTIAWLAHQMCGLFDDEDRRVFDSVVIVTDLRVLDRQLRRVVQQFEATPGLVEAVTDGSLNLKTALEQGKQIIITTIQKFPFIARQVKELGERRFALLIDEAHSSQSGEMGAAVKRTLGPGDEDGTDEDAEDEVERALREEMAGRGWPKNVSYFAFTATPKPKTLELFGTRNSRGGFEPFSLYSMRQAIEEGFILDVLQNYTTYRTYFRLLKTAADDPQYDKSRAQFLLKQYVEAEPETIEQKINIALDHFELNVERMLDGKSKAMFVTRSRLHAVRFKLALDRILKARGLTWKSVVAFSQTVQDMGADYSEAGMNGFPEAQTVERFKAAEVRFMVVAEKFQTGFDQPLLCAMYVDKKLGGVNAVQTLSRLNRIYPGKEQVYVLDFVNEPDAIRVPFEQAYCKTVLIGETDPNQLYDLQRSLEQAHVYTPEDLAAFKKAYFRPRREGELAGVYATMEGVLQRFQALPLDPKIEFKGALKDFARLYGFVMQVAVFKDAGLELLYHYARLLWRRLEVEQAGLPWDVLGKVDLDTVQIQQRATGRIALMQGQGEVQPNQAAGGKGGGARNEELLSRIIREMNDRFGLDLKPEHADVIRGVQARLLEDEALRASAEANSQDAFKLVFQERLKEKLEELYVAHFDVYEKLNGKPPLEAFLAEVLLRDFLEKRGVELPNAFTRRAIAELEAGEGKKFRDVKALLADLNEEH